MHPTPDPSAWICQFLGCETPLLPALLKPASLHGFTQVWGMWCTSSPPPLLMDLYTFYVFLIRIQFKKKVDMTHHPSLGPALPTLRSHLYCCSYGMKHDGRRANHIIVEKENSWPNRKETLIISVKLQPNVISCPAMCDQCKKQDFQTQVAFASSNLYEG